MRPRLDPVLALCLRADPRRDPGGGRVHPYDARGRVTAALATGSRARCDGGRGFLTIGPALR